MATEYRYEYGKRWNRLTPRGSISWLMGRVHVGTPDEEIEADIRKRCTNPQFTPALIEESVRYALLVHARNRDLYKCVVSGRI